jgi:hypothetical protein
VAYFWSARERLDDGWREEIVRFVAAVPGVGLDVTAGAETSVRLAAGVDEVVEFRFARGRGGGTVALTAGARLVLVSLGVAARLKLALSDRHGEALELCDLRAALGRIPFTEGAVAIATLAEDVGLLPRRVRLAALSPPAHCGQCAGVFFASRLPPETQAASIGKDLLGSRHVVRGLV